MSNKRDIEKKRAYNRAYCASNRDRIAARKRANYLTDRERILASRKTYRASNRDQILVKAKAQYDANREKILAQKKIYYQTNRDSCNARAKAYWAANKQDLSVRKKAYRDATKEQRSATKKAWYRANRTSLNVKSYQRKIQRLETDPIFKLSESIRKKLRCRLRYANISKVSKTFALIGCSISELKAYLEANFYDGMTWANYGSYWHIDHIRPCASFDLTKIDQQHLCFHWSNLQPLLASQNFTKSATWNGEYHRREKAA
jgi:Prasinovirus endonuclease VII